jgi:hypothetical protein
VEEGGAATEDEMIAVFLAGELTSSRFPQLRDLLATRAIDETTVTSPDLGDVAANELRRLLLLHTRGYPFRHLFIGFPTDARWQWCWLEPDELSNLRYVNTPPWSTTISGGTRQPADGATYIKAHPEDGMARVCAAIAKRLEAGEALPPLILFGDPGKTRLVVLEGHARLTAMVMAGSHTASPVRILCGTSPNVDKWHLY